jgi:hypothetical protein
MRRLPFSSLPQRLAVLVGGVALLASSLVGMGTAHASFGWCVGDPIVLVNGVQLQTYVGVYTDSSLVKSQVQGAVVTYAVPAGVTISLEMATSPYFPEQVRFTTSTVAWTPGQPIPVTVSVQFQTTTSLQTELVNQATSTNYPSVYSTSGKTLSTTLSLSGSGVSTATTTLTTGTTAH